MKSFYTPIAENATHKDFFIVQKEENANHAFSDLSINY